MSTEYTVPEWFEKKRLMIKDAFEIGTPKMHLKKVYKSPMKKYELMTIPHQIQPNAWDYCEARLYDREKNEYLLSVYRNYGTFPHCWIENHPTMKRDFLICGEDYQGITVVDIKTKQVYTWIQDKAQGGTAFCPSNFIPSPDMSKIAVVGCFWACPYEVKVFEMKKSPKNFPWRPMISQTLGWRDGEEYICGVEVLGWIDDENMLISSEDEYVDAKATKTVDEESAERCDRYFEEHGKNLFDDNDAFHKMYEEITSKVFVKLIEWNLNINTGSIHKLSETIAPKYTSDHSN